MKFKPFSNVSVSFAIFAITLVITKLSHAVEVPWQALKIGDLQVETNANTVTITNNSSTPAQATIAVVENPNITSNQYGIRGELVSEGVEGSAHLEMWNHFPDGSAYFTKTLSESGGPMGVIRGTTSQREFLLPFDRSSAPPPTKLEVRVVMPGKGRIEIRNADLVDGPILTNLTSTIAGSPFLALIMIGVAVLLAGIISIAVFLLVLKAKRRTELRRMSALDAR